MGDAGDRDGALRGGDRVDCRPAPSGGRGKAFPRLENVSSTIITFKYQQHLHGDSINRGSILVHVDMAPKPAGPPKAKGGGKTIEGGGVDAKARLEAIEREIQEQQKLRVHAQLERVRHAALAWHPH